MAVLHSYRTGHTHSHPVWFWCLVKQYPGILPDVVTNSEFVDNQGFQARVAFEHASCLLGCMLHKANIG